MSYIGRLVYVVAGTILNATQAILYFRAGGELFPMATGQYAGPFSFVAVWAQNAWAAEIVILQVFLIAYLIYGGVQEEQAAQRRVVRR